MQDSLDQISLQKSVLSYFVGETGCGRHNSRRWKTTELFIPSHRFRALYHSRYIILAKSGTLYISSGVSECCFLLWIGIMPKKPIYLAHLTIGTTHLWHGQAVPHSFSLFYGHLVQSQMVLCGRGVCAFRAWLVKVAISKLMALSIAENDQVWSSPKQELLLQLSTWRTKPLVVTSIKEK
jgi:hypothetical protein